jgi:hypothetical protein
MGEWRYSSTLALDGGEKLHAPGAMQQGIKPPSAPSIEM